MQSSSGLNYSKPVVYFHNSPSYSQIVPAYYQKPINSNFNSISQIGPFNQINQKFSNNYHNNRLYLSQIPQFKYYTKRQNIMEQKNVEPNNFQKYESLQNRKYLNSNYITSKYNTSERISQQAEYLQSSTKNMPNQSCQMPSYSKYNARQSSQSPSKQKKQQSFYNFQVKPQPVYCILCERYYEFQQQKEHLQKHRKPKNSPLKKDVRQLNEKVNKFEKKIPISVPSQFLITQNVCTLSLEKQRKQVQINTSQRDFKNLQNLHLQIKNQKNKQKFDSPQIQFQKNKINLQKQNKSLSKKSVPKLIQSNIDLKQNQLRHKSNITKNSQDLKKQDIVSLTQKQVIISPSQYNISQKNMTPNYSRKDINSETKLKQQQKSNLQEQKQNKATIYVQQNSKWNNENGIKQKHQLRNPTAKIQKPVYNQGLSKYEQSVVQIQPTEFNFDEQMSLNGKKYHKSEKNYSNKKNNWIINLSQKKPALQVKEQSNFDNVRQSSQKAKSIPCKIEKNQSVLSNMESNQNLFKKKKSNQTFNKVLSCSNQQNNKNLYLQIESNKISEQKSNKQGKNNFNQNSSSHKKSVHRKSANNRDKSLNNSEIQLVDIGVGDFPVQFQQPEPNHLKSNSNIKSSSSKKQKKGKNMLINQLY